MTGMLVVTYSFRRWGRCRIHIYHPITAPDVGGQRLGHGHIGHEAVGQLLFTTR